MKSGIDINPGILEWAIGRAGYGLDEFAAVFPKILDWVEDEKKPTIRQLENFSKKVHMPFGYLFLKEPPLETLPIPFFRTNQKRGQGNAKVSINVYDTILLFQQRQDWLKDYLKGNDTAPLPFVGKYHGQQDYIKIVENIRITLNLEPEWASTIASYSQAIDFLTQKIEGLDIIVGFNGVVENNNKRPISVEECRGFVLVDELAPFMFINNADAKAAQLFTLAHELAHIWIGNSAGFDNSKLMPADDPIEQLCDKVAAEFLVPERSFDRVWNQQSNIPFVAKYFKVSQIVVARRALDLNKITRRAFFSFYDDYVNGIKEKKKATGGDFYATTKKRLSLTFAGHVNHAVKSDRLLYRDAYKLTSLKGDTYKKFFDKYF